MTRSERVRYEVLLRVSDFGAAHRALFPESSTGGQIFTKLARAVAEIDANAKVKLLAAREGVRAKAAARKAVRRGMLILARTTRKLAITTQAPDLATRFAIPRGKADVTLLRSARTFLQEGTAIDSALVDFGVAVTFLDEFRQAVDSFEEAMTGRRVGRSDVAKAQKAITAALGTGMDAARTLDVIVANVLDNDPALFAKWQRDRRLVDGKRKGEPPTVDSSPSEEMLQRAS